MVSCAIDTQRQRRVIMYQKTLAVLRTGTIALALCGAAVAIPTWASPDQGGEHHMLERMSRQLDLADDQRSAVAKLMAQTREEGAADRERMREIRRLLRERGDAVDAATAQSLTEELGQITLRSADRRAETQAAVRELLDEEQRQRMDEMHSKRAEGWQQRKGHEQGEQRYRKGAGSGSKAEQGQRKGHDHSGNR